MLMTIIGTVGAILLALSALPQLVAAIRAGHARGLSWGLLMAWLWGELAMLVWAVSEDPSPILLANYGGNAVLVAALCWYRLR
jgi:uncharacterized protein with PQ loop repeat